MPARPIGPVPCPTPDGSADTARGTAGTGGAVRSLLAAHQASPDVETPRTANWHTTYDPLTGLANRAMFLERLAVVLARGASDGVTAVMFIDLDDFKDVNDGHGHRVGDEVLVETGRRLVEVVRPDDMVSRLGGDEFVVICAGLAKQADAVRVANRLLAAVSAPILVGGDKINDEVVVTSSVGITLAGAGASDPEAVLHEADSAMYRAKARGKNQVEVFDDALRETANNRLSTEALLRRALADELFRLHYQPIYELATGDLTGVESLLRVEDPEHGFLSPARFIDVAERSGLIVPIGAWVLQESCRQLAQWRAAGLIRHDVRVAVNLSARQVSRSDLLKTVSRALDDAGLEPTALSLELTESIFMDADSAHVRQLEELRAMGVTIEIDDFGTGYSSLAYLKRLPVGVVKVDQSFVAGMLTSVADHGIVSSVIGLGQALGLVTIAEGVETGDQLDALWVLGCDQAQGYHLGRPSPPSQPPLAVTDWGEQAASVAM
jgi:diguanylate cyclase (GGDEF)-like protein